MKSRRLIPITGALVAGLIGTTSMACFYYTSAVCVSGGSQVGSTSPSMTGQCDPNPRAIRADGDWILPTYSTTRDGQPNGWQNLLSAADCHGPAYYQNCSGGVTHISNYTTEFGQTYVEPRQNPDETCP